MNATITPRGRTPYDVQLAIDKPITFTNDEELGWRDGSVTLLAPLPIGRLAFIRDAEIVVNGPYGVLYWGVIRSAPTAKTLECTGLLQYLLDGAPRSGVYCDTDLSGFKERTLDGRNKKMACTVENSRLRVSMEDGVAVGTKSNGFWVREPDRTSNAVLTFDWSRPSTSIRLRIYAGPYAGQESDGDEITTGQWTAWEQVNGSGALSGSATVALNQDHDCYQFNVDAPSGYTPGSDVAVVFKNIKYKGCGVTTLNPTTIIGDCLDELATGAIGGRDIATDATTLEPFVTPGTERDRIEAVRTFVGGVFRAEMRDAARPYAVFKARPTVPAYYFTEDGVTVIADDLKIGASLDQLYSAVRVIYRWENGQERYVDCFDSDPTHYLVKIGRCGTAALSKWAPTLTVDTTSATLAPAAGKLYLSLVGSDSVNGTLLVISEQAGYTLPGELAQITTRDNGTVTGRIRSLSTEGVTRAKLLIDNTENPADLVARAVARAKRFRTISGGGGNGGRH